MLHIPYTTDMNELPQLSGPMMEPASGGAPKQIILFLHGVGADGQDLIGLAPFFAEQFPDALFISPNAPFPCDMAPFGYQWFSLLDRDPEVLLAGVRQAEPIVNGFIDSLLERYQLPISKLAIVGFSQGTMTSLYTLLRRAEPVAALVGFSGAMIGTDRLAGEVTCKPPVCLIHGDRDMVVPFAAMEIASEALGDAGVEHETHARPGLGHGIDPEGIDIARGFLGKYLT